MIDLIIRRMHPGKMFIRCKFVDSCKELIFNFVNMNLLISCSLLLTISLASRAENDIDLPVCDKPFVTCGIFCQNGYLKDENGCDRCACVDDEIIICPILEECADPPEDCVRETDENGCPTCDCVPECEPKNCGIVPVMCEYGFETNADGCETCTCNPPPICPGDPEPVNCGSSCGPATCKQQITAVYPLCLGCVPSCACPEPGTFLDTNDKCILPENCGCVDSNDNYYRQWTINSVYDGGRRRKCVCLPGNLLICSRGTYYG
ncbi:cysteine-rich motor neuron 1 protein-like [Anneissia japonica]|uniref:cysteine-rich motor neuron 1 protein-like n=1 Tax=Anneissia japonica TaxID=1529436 RepID=UPI001425B008|nr:cysteine-rich motor neuron 1 protein-like [Anneissia japonica]